MKMVMKMVIVMVKKKKKKNVCLLKSFRLNTYILRELFSIIQ